MFVKMRHPSIPATELTPVEVSLSSVDDHAARGWLLVDPGVTPPPSSLPYATVAQVASQLPTAGTPIGDAARAAFALSAGAEPTDAKVAAFVGTKGTTTRGLLDAGFLPGIILTGPGIDPTGATDSTAAMQAIIDAHPGRTLDLPAGLYEISTLTLGQGQYLRGAGWQDYRDRKTLFGTAGWTDDANFAGTVIRSTVEVGSALTLLAAEVTQGGFEGFALVGPGSGDGSIGITIGGDDMSVVHPIVRNVNVGNFAVGVQTKNINEASVYDLTIHGCTIGLDLTDGTIQNGFYGLDLQRNVDGLHLDPTCFANAFYSPIAQSNVGVGFVIDGNKNLLLNPYCENNAGGGVRVNAGLANAIVAPFLNDAEDGLLINAAASDTTVSGFGNEWNTAPLTNYGVRSYLQGNMSTLLDEGAASVVIDAARGAVGDTGWRSIDALSNGWTAGALQVRRVGRIVSVRWYALDGASATAPAFYAMPTGFRVGGGDSHMIPVAANPTTVAVLLAEEGANLSLPTGAAYGTGRFSLVQYPTTDLWPTALPGVAA